MKRETKRRKIRLSLPTVGILLLILATVAVIVVSVLQMRARLYREQSGTLRKLMEKNSQSIETVLQDRWDDAGFCARDLASREYEDEQAILERLGWLQKNLEHGDVGCYLIDNSGICRGADGAHFRWKDAAGLSGSESRVYIFDLPGREGEQIIFPVRFTRPVRVGDRLYTHLALSCDMVSLDSYFHIREYGSAGTTYVIRPNGTQVYRHEQEEGDGGIRGLYNVLEFLRLRETVFSAPGATAAEELEKGVAGCAAFRYGREDYFAVYQPLSIAGWQAVLLVPAELAGSSSELFMRDLILNMILIALLVLAVLASLIVASNRRVRRQQEAVTESLRRAAEQEHTANLAKSRFLSSMSHDIRTPMNAIVGMTAIAQKHINDKNRVTDCLEKIDLSSRHLLTLINDVLDISKIESGKLALNPTAFSLRESLTTVVDIVRPLVRQKKLRFDVHLHGVEYETLIADGVRVNQIFINVLSNAVKYNVQGGEVAVDLRQRLLPGGETARITYIVSDTGIGMSESFMEHMYDTFSRADNVRAGQIQGSGLGLAIVKQMVDMMGGTIECKSAQGVGTTFTITLDLLVEKDTPPLPPLPEARVLLVDDDTVLLQTAGETLHSLGLTVDSARGGRSALEQVRKKHAEGDDYAAVLLDLHMPEPDGLATLLAIRDLAGDRVPVLLMSAYDWTEVEREISDEADGFLSKPLFKSLLHEKLYDLLRPGREKAVRKPVRRRDLNGRHLLVAEDNDLNWEIIQELLAAEGITAQRAENGLVAVKKLSESPEGSFDLVLMDIQMPLMNGREATRCIRADERPAVRDIPIVAMTADAFAEDIAACLDAGMDGHVSKPVDMDKLLHAVRLALAKRRGGEGGSGT